MKKIFYILSGIVLLISPGYAQILADINFSAQRGLYDNLFALELSSDNPAAQIFYTLDGSEPSSSNGTAYTGSIQIQATTLVRAVAYTTTDTSSISTHSYIFPDDVFNQQGIPTGYPDSWTGYPADYDVDTYIANDPGYHNMIRESFEDIPSISLVLNKDDLFSQETGIYENSEERGVPWERATSIEMIRPDGIEGFQENAGLRISGNSTRNPDYFKKHAFRVLFKSQYGAGQLKYPVFGEEGAEEFNTLVLRMMGHFSVHDWNEYRRNKTQIGKDQFARELQRDMGNPHVRGIFVHLFLNGMYWGIYNMTERPDAAYMSSYFGGDREDYDVINSLKIVEGDSIAWYEMHDLAQAGLTTDSAYQAMEGYLDIDNFYDYMILNHWGINTDWDFHNWYAARKREPGGQFKFFSWDAEFILGYFNYNEIVYNSGTDDYLYPRFLFHKLMENENARRHFGDRVECSCKGGGALSEAAPATHYAGLTAAIDNISVAETARWGDVTGSLYTYNVHIAPEATELLTVHLPSRTNDLLDLYRSRGVYPALQSVNFSKYGGQLGISEEIALFNPNNYGTIYYTLDGTNPRNEDGTISSAATEFTNTLIIPLDGVTEVRARVYNPDDQEWSAMCPQRFYKVEDRSGIVINEIHYNPDSLCSINTQTGELDYIELTNSNTWPVDLTDCSFTKGIRYKFPYKTVLEPGEFYVIAENTDSFSAHYGFIPDGEYLDALSNGGDLLILKDAFGYLIDSLTYNDANPWDIAPDGKGMSLELINPKWDNSNPLHWFRADRECGGTPRQINSRYCAGLTEELVINEINYNSDASTDPGDWVELYNPTQDSIHLSGWQFFDEKNDFTFSENISIAPDEYLVLAEDSLMFSNIFPNVKNYVGSFGFNLSGGGERITLLTDGGCVADYVIYDDDAPWDTIPDGNGPTLSLAFSLYDNTQASYWEASSNINALLGTPGRANLPCPIAGVPVVPQLCAREAANFTLDTLYDGMEYQWSFWNGNQDATTGDTIQVIWDEPGNYSVDLIASYYDCVNISFVPVEVTICNEAPVAVNDTITTLEDTTVPVNLLSNDFDPDGDMLSTYAIIDTPSSGTLYEEGNGLFTYEPDDNDSGELYFTYQVCDDDAYSLCDTATVIVMIEEVEDAPIAVNDLFSIEEDNLLSSNIIINDYEPDGDVLILSQNLVVFPLYGTVSVDANGNFDYEPNPDYYGQDNFSYEVCGGMLCDTAQVFIDILSVNDAPVVVNDTFYLKNDSLITYNVFGNDYDIDGDNLSATLLGDPLTGILNLSQNGALVYAPPIDFVGTEIYTYQVCDDGTPNLCESGTLVFIVESNCIDIQLFVLMEGPYQPDVEAMSTTLNSVRGILPGQEPASYLTTPTPPGHPYSQAPWNYSGDEGMDFIGDEYSSGVVDWILLSFRTSPEANTVIAKTAALIHSDGSIELLDECLFTRSTYEPSYIVVEHRNHIGVMSPEAVSLDGELLYFDFTLQNSFKDPTSNGQKQYEVGKWMMFGADGDQTVDFQSYDINGLDKSFWLEDNGTFDVYSNADYNMDGDVSGADKVIWYLNNGVSSRVPR